MIRNFSKIRSLRQFTADSQEVQIVLGMAYCPPPMMLLFFTLNGTDSPDYLVA